MLNYNKIHSNINYQKTAKSALAKYMGIANSTLLDRLEKKNLTPDDVEKIADYFGRPISYYFDREEKEQPVQKVLKAEEVINVAEEPCPCCEKLKAEVERLTEKLSDKQETINALKEANAALRGDVKKEEPFTDNQKAG